jgi:NAD(P)H-nitrite reductase large subunit
MDDELCLCFHVTKRKVLNYLRIEQPQRVAQLSQCFGAGTGCGWCRPFLKKLFQQMRDGQDAAAALPASDDYAISRSRYVLAGRGTPPPGATPIRRLDG